MHHHYLDNKKIKLTMTPGSRQVILGSRFRPFLISSLPRLAGNHNDDGDDGDDDDDDDDDDGHDDDLEDDDEDL